jgi:hypothetical protein
VEAVEATLDCRRLSPSVSEWQQERQQGRPYLPLRSNGSRAGSRAGSTHRCAGGDYNGYGASPLASMPG